MLQMIRLLSWSQKNELGKAVQRPKLWGKPWTHGASMTKNRRNSHKLCVLSSDCILHLWTLERGNMNASLLHLVNNLYYFSEIAGMPGWMVPSRKGWRDIVKLFLFSREQTIHFQTGFHLLCVITYFNSITVKL